MAAPVAAAIPALPHFGELNVVSRKEERGVRIYETAAPTPNTKAQNSAIKQVHDFVGSAYGAYRFTQIPGKTLTLAAEVATLAGAAEETVGSMKDVAKVFNTAANGMIWGYWTWSTFEVGEQVLKVYDEGAGEGRIVELFRRCIDWVTSACHSLGSVLPSFKSIFGPVSTATDFAVDMIESGQAAHSWMQADHLLTQHANLSQEVQEGLNSEKTLQLVALFKSVIAATLGAFAILSLVLGSVILPAVVTATMGLATLILALAKHFHRENMHTQPLNKWDWTAAAAN